MAHKVRFHLSFSQIQGSGIYPTFLRELAKQTEELGYQGLTHGDAAVLPAQRTRALPDELNPGHLSCLPMLAHFAAVTHKIILGSNPVTVPLYHPSHVAGMAATVDNVSGGRLLLRTGSGTDPVQYKAFRLPFEHRGSILVEAIQIIRALWTQDDVSFKGKYFELEHVKLATAKPIQKPHPPIWIDTIGEKEYLLRRVARYADGWDKLYSISKTHVNPKFFDAEEFRREIRFIKDEAKKAGRDPEAIRHSPGSLVLAIGKDDAATKKLANDYLLKVRGESPGSPSSGDPKHVTSYIKQAVEAGATDFTINFVPYSIAENMEMMELFAKEVIPAFA